MSEEELSQQSEDTVPENSGEVSEESKNAKRQKGKNIPVADEKSLENIESKKRQSEYTKYSLPGNSKQILEVMRLEFKHYFKGKGLIFLYILGALVPIVQMTNVADIIGLLSTMFSLFTGSSGTTSLQYLHYNLILLPTIMVLCVFILCGKTISQEYTERTCFLNFPLPVEKWVMFTGKYIATAIASFSVILFTYGFSMLSTNVKYGTIVIQPVLVSLALAFITMLALISIGMIFSCALRRASGLASLLTMMFGIPLIPFVLSMAVKNTMDSWAAPLVEAFMYTPSFATDFILIALGWDPTMSMSGFVIGNVIQYTPNLWLVALTMLAWAAVLFYFSIRIFIRREV